MIHTFTHPTIKKLLVQSEVEVFCQKSSIEVVFISDYFPQVSPQIHGGLIEAVKYRLTYPTSYICIFSFYSKEELLQYDTFGILSLAGTVFLRLPFLPEQLKKKLEVYTQIQLSIPNEEWIIFSTNACKILLKEKLRVLKHGGKLEFVSFINIALRIEVRNCLSNPERIVELKKLLANLQSKFSNNSEFAALIELSNVCESVSDDYLQNVAKFVKGLMKLESLATISRIDLEEIKKEIEKLISNFEKIQTP